MDDGGTTTIYNLTGGSTGGTSTGGGVQSSQLRVAALSYNAPAFDYCLAVHGTETPDSGFVGPVLYGRGAYGGLIYPSVSDYSPFPPATYDLRFVQPASQDCYPTTPISPDITSLPALAAGESYTVSIMGPIIAPTVLTLTDDTTTTADSSVRLIQATHGFAPIDMTANTKLLFADVPYATVPAAGGSIDANGYSTLMRPSPGLSDAGFQPPLTYALTFAVHGSSNDVLVVPCVTFTEGSVNSVFTIPPPTNYTGTLTALVCYDSLEPALGLTQCVPLPVPGSTCP